MGIVTSNIMRKWKDIKTENDISELMETYGSFHDSCIVSLNYQSGNSVDNNKTMNFGSSNEYELNIVFNSQWNPKVLELKFIGVRQMHITGWQDNYMNDIFEAKIAFYDELFTDKTKKLIVWSDYEDFDPLKINSNLQEPGDTYIIADSLKWRIID